MKNIIKDRLNRISDLNERKIYKKIIVELYEELIDYNMNMHEKLEGRIYNEIDDPIDKFYIYSTVMDITEIDPISDFFHPIVQDDLNLLTFDMKEVAQKLQSDSEIVISTIFLKCDYLLFQEIINNDKNYKGFIKTNKDIYEINIKLKQSMKYIKEIQNLYHVFQLNLIEWNTINCPYAYRFADVILNSSINLKQNEEIKEIIIDLAEYEKYKNINKIPVWNIKRIKVQDKSYPMPAQDRINHEHKISLSETGIQNKYMLALENEEFEYTKRYKDELVIISKKSKQFYWNLLQIENISNISRNTLKYNFEVLSNRRDLEVVGKFTSLKSLVIRTRGEIAHLITLYELRKDLSFYDVELVNNYTKTIQTINYNNFIDDNIRDNNSKQILVVKFKADNREEFLIFDKMSFLVSELQILFPEYKCIGELI